MAFRGRTRQKKCDIEQANEKEREKKEQQRVDYSAIYMPLPYKTNEEENDERNKNNQTKHIFS